MNSVVLNSGASWEEIERWYHDALDMPVDERRAFLAQASAEVREEVESLLEADSGASLLNAPPMHLAADLLNSQREGLARGDRVAHYEVESLISTGGMGEVYLAHDTAGKRVALKVLRRHLIVNAQALERFEIEARAASALQHPNIVAVYEFSEWEGGSFIAMEWLDGSTFRAVMNAGQVEIPLAIDYAAQAACALSAAHGAGILHRDIKPDNILLCKDGVVKILDFGLARSASSIGPDPELRGASGTITGSLSGTLLYMPPEILRGETATTASDVFSLGAFLYELFTGRHPFGAETPLEVLEAIEGRAVLSPAATRAGVPPQIDQLILRMLDRRPDRRPLAGEVWDALAKER